MQNQQNFLLVLAHQVYDIFFAYIVVAVGCFFDKKVDNNVVLRIFTLCIKQWISVISSRCYKSERQLPALNLDTTCCVGVTSFSSKDDIDI